MNKKILLLWIVFIQSLVSFSQVDRYQVSADVGTDIQLSAPPPRDTERKTLHNVFWSVTTGSSCAVVLNATSNPVTVRIIAEGTAVVKCEVNYYDPYYWSINHPIYGSDVRQYGYYTITCNGTDPDPGPGPDPDPGTDTYSHVTTIEGYPMWYCLTTIYNERACIIKVPPFRPSSESCIDQNVEGKVTIPSENIDGYPVRSIASGAFLNNKKITEVVIPSSVKYISENSFYGCYSLEKVVCENPTPPTGLAINHICSNDQSVTLYVPKGAVSAYKAADGWSNFKEIREIGSEDYIHGDVNGDGIVNGTDLVVLTNMILGKSAKTDAADVNNDGQVNGTDYVALVNIVLGRSNTRVLQLHDNEK